MAACTLRIPKTIVSASEPDNPDIQMGEFFFASEEASRVYIFDAAGRHLRTVSALTGAVLYRFSYDANGC